MKDNAQKDQVPYTQHRAWEFRGTVLGLVIGAASSSVGQVMLLIPMLIHVIFGNDTIMKCDNEHHPALARVTIYLCEYTTAYVVSFPVLAATGLMLIIGRNLLQKRLYYGVLQGGGVMGFSQNQPLKDSIVVLLIWCYLHCVSYLVLVLWVCYREGNFKTVDGAVHMEPKAFGLIMGVISLLLLPATFFIIFFYGAYDIEASLVPLSQFVHDAEDVTADSDDDAENSLMKLKMMHDGIAKAVLEENEDLIFATKGDHEDKNRKLVQYYRKNEKEHAKDELPTLTLWKSFWPGLLLLKPDITEDYAQRFKTLWFAVTAFFFLVFIGMLVFLGIFIGFDCYTLFGHAKYQSIPHLVVFALHFIVVTAFMLPFLETVSWRWKKSPLAVMTPRVAEGRRPSI
jgi:hypothetical protein